MPKAENRSSQPTTYSPYNRPVRAPNEVTVSESAVTDPPEYRLNFGSYAGKTLTECPPRYISSLIDYGAPNSRPDLKEAIDAYQRNPDQAQRAPRNETGSSGSPNIAQLTFNVEAPKTPARTAIVRGNHGSESTGVGADTLRQATPLHIKSEPNLSPSPVHRIKPEPDENSRIALLAADNERTPSMDVDHQHEVHPVPQLEPSDGTGQIEQEIEAATYILDFGKHKGSELSKVPLSYVRYLVDNVMATRPSLKQALIDEGFVNPATGKLQISPTTPNRSQPPVPSNDVIIKQEPIDHVPYVLDFGKYKGSRLSDMADSYLGFLATTCIETMPLLRQAMINEGFIDQSTGKLRASRPSVKNEDDTETGNQIPASYTLDFGKHSGSKIYEVPLHYLASLANKSNSYSLARNPLLEQAMIDEGYLDPSTKEMHNYRTLTRDMPLPPLSRASTIFCDEYDDYKPLWIFQGDAYNYFGLTTNLMDGLPLVRKKSSKRSKCYYLYHVYELFKRYRPFGPAAATALVKWKDLNVARGEDIMAGMGLGECLCYSPLR